MIEMVASLWEEPEKKRATVPNVTILGPCHEYLHPMTPHNMSVTNAQYLASDSRIFYGTMA
jgi:hypothetical protein